MTDRAPPKAKKGAKKDTAVKGPKKPKLDPHQLKGIGHNSGQVIPELVNLVDELLASSERQKREGQLQRDLRNRAKSEFGVLSGPLSHEIRLRKMDKDVRVQFESGHGDLKQALGYQPELDFQDGVPTKASAKAQPSEAQMASKDPSPQRFEVDPEEGEDAEDEADKKQPAKHEAAPAKKNVIEREG